jgi:hypothetical protein
MAKFEKAGKAFRIDEYIILPSWPKHQQYEKRRKIKEGIIHYLQLLPKNVYAYLEECGYRFNLALVEGKPLAERARAGISGTKRKAVVERQGGKCAVCGAEKRLYINRIEGDSNAFENLEALCEDCYKKKSVRISYSDKNGLDTESGGLVSDFQKVRNYSEFEFDSEFDSDLESEFERGDEQPQKQAAKFKKPTLEEVKAYCEERHNRIDPGRFIDYYESKDWMIGRNRMKNWQAAVRNWERNEQAPVPGSPAPKRGPDWGGAVDMGKGVKPKQFFTEGDE